ncbi:uncharacterized protein LOC142350798 [Convolutriloba macropyga]|uniref:uncharacterized protein LOC142350798 n=1 Tax=Convolutriloba macropyga TaxID=536237 RepID=UPI003F5257BB
MKTLILFVIFSCFVYEKSVDFLIKRLGFSAASEVGGSRVAKRGGGQSRESSDAGDRLGAAIAREHGNFGNYQNFNVQPLSGGGLRDQGASGIERAFRGYNPERGFREYTPDLRLDSSDRKRRLKDGNVVVFRADGMLRGASAIDLTNPDEDAGSMSNAHRMDEDVITTTTKYMPFGDTNPLGGGPRYHEVVRIVPGEGFNSDNEEDVNGSSFPPPYTTPTYHGPRMDFVEEMRPLRSYKTRSNLDSVGL